MEIRQFRNKYGLELIPASNAGIIVGALVWNPLTGKPKFTHPGMPKHIFNAFLDAELLEEAEWQKYLNDAQNEPLVEANMAESMINVDVDVAATLGYPQLGSIGNSFDLSKIRKFTFGHLQARIMSNLYRVRIDDYLEALKKNKWREYDGKIRKVFMITELYFGSMKLVIEKQWRDSFSAALATTNLGIEAEVGLGKSTEYTFNHQNVPFAMRIEKVREFNG